MDCSLNLPLSSEEFLREFNKKVSKNRVPLSGSIALTNHCNLRCVHCYLGDRKKKDQNSGPELNTDQWKKVIDEITEAGCLFLLITGGEPFLRRDFPRIYNHAKNNGLLVTVFSNGTLLEDTVFELFTEFPPKAVEITLYGATAQTFEKITRVKGSFGKCIQAIIHLKEEKVNLRLKTILLKQNQDEFFAIESLARSLDLKFRFDAAIFPTLDGNKSPIEMRVSAEDAVEREFSDLSRSQEWENFYKRLGKLPDTDSLYRCGAGHSHFYIDPYGYLYPCLMVTDLNYNLLKGNFLAGWNTVMPRLRLRKSGADNICKGCEKKNLCGFCPGLFNLETGSEEVCAEYLCELGQYRYHKLKLTLKNGNKLLKRKGESLEIETR